MKTILFSFFFSLVVNTVFAQYQSILGSENTSWDMAVTASGIFSDPYLDSCYVANDTIIGDFEYSKICWKYLHFTNPDQAKGYLREDTTSGKAWFLFEYSGVELPIMDLSLEVGDTFYLAAYDVEALTPIVADSVYSFEGRKHIRFDYPVYNQPGEKFTMIEGVGTSFGLNFQDPTFFFLIHYYTLCQTKNDNLSYVNNSPFFGGLCDVSTTQSEESLYSIISINLYPNPVSEIINFDLGSFPLDSFYLEIYDCTGCRIFDKKEINFLVGHKYQLNVSGWQSGVYFVRLSYKNSHTVLSFVVL